jgi:hypothetical protein
MMRRVVPAVVQYVLWCAAMLACYAVYFAAADTEVFRYIGF